MNTEGKAKAYNKVREKIALRFGSNVAEEIFSEFEETDDERIRKDIIAFIKKRDRSGCDYDYDKWIAWLEKQKEYESTDFEYVWDRTDCGDLTSALDKYSKEAIINMCHAWYDKGIELERKSWIEKQGYTKKDVDDAYLKGICNTKHELEKQGDQKSVDKEYTFKSIPRLLDMIESTDRAKSYCKKLIDSLQTEGYSIDAKIVGECLKQMNGEKVAMATMDDQNPADKIEPKFQNGQWIVWQNKCYKVNYNGCGYELIDQNGLSTSLEYGTVDASARLWDITKDVRDGDVLYHKAENGIEYIVMGKGLNEHNNIDSYFRYNSIDGFGIDIPSVLSAKYDSITPATKEQRDTLIKAMADAGYTFDFEKKELKNIKQNIAEWSEEDIRNIENIDSVLFYDKDLPEETCMRLRNWLQSLKPNKDMIEALRTEYEKGRADTIAEMKSSWSEEDEVKINRIVACLENLNVADNDILLKDVDWIKQLKQRIGG